MGSCLSRSGSQRDKFPLTTANREPTVCCGEGNRWIIISNNTKHKCVGKINCGNDHQFVNVKAKSETKCFHITQNGTYVDVFAQTESRWNSEKLIWRQIITRRAVEVFGKVNIQQSHVDDDFRNEEYSDPYKQTFSRRSLSLNRERSSGAIGLRLPLGGEGYRISERSHREGLRTSKPDRLMPSRSTSGEVLRFDLTDRIISAQTTTDRSNFVRMDPGQTDRSLPSSIWDGHYPNISKNGETSPTANGAKIIPFENLRDKSDCTSGSNWEPTSTPECKRDAPIGSAWAEKSKKAGSLPDERDGKGTAPSPGARSANERDGGKKGNRRRGIPKESKRADDDTERQTSSLKLNEPTLSTPPKSSPGENRVSVGSSQKRPKENYNVNNNGVIAPLPTAVHYAATTLVGEETNNHLLDREITGRSLIVIEKRAVSKPDEITLDIGKTSDKSTNSKSPSIAFLDNATFEISRGLKSQADESIKPIQPSDFKREENYSLSEKPAIILPIERGMFTSLGAKKENPEGGLSTKVDNLDLNNSPLERGDSSGGITITSTHLHQSSTLHGSSHLMRRMTDYDSSS